MTAVWRVTRHRGRCMSVSPDDIMMVTVLRTVDESMTSSDHAHSYGCNGVPPARRRDHRDARRRRPVAYWHGRIRQAAPRPWLTACGCARSPAAAPQPLPYSAYCRPGHDYNVTGSNVRCSHRFPQGLASADFVVDLPFTIPLGFALKLRSLRFTHPFYVASRSFQ